MTRAQLLEQQRTDLCTLVTELNKDGEFRTAISVMTVIEANAAVTDALCELGLEDQEFPQC